MLIKVCDKIYIFNCPEEKKASMKKTLTLPNPNFFKMKAMGKWTGGTPSSFKYYEESGAAFIIPRGLTERIKRFLPEAEIKYETVEKKFDLKLNDITLRDYQEQVLSVWRAKGVKEGVFNLATATGKTVLALQVAKELGLTCTFLVTTNVILDQFVSEAKKFLGYDIGVINGKKKEIKDITVANVSSLFNNEELLTKLAAHTSVLIVDECAGFVSDKRVKVLEQFYPTYLYGLSGTPQREDGQSEAIFFYFGGIIESYEGTVVDPIVEVINSRVFIPIKINYHEMIDDQISSDSRNKLISGLALGEMLKGRKVLILTKRIEHYQEIRKRLPSGDGIIVADSTDKELGDHLDQLRKYKRDFNCIIGTFSLLGTGFNIEQLDTLIIAGDLKSSILTTQAAGRILRLLKGKNAKIIDLWDAENGILSRQFQHRKKLYEKKKWKVVMPWDSQLPLKDY